MDPDSQDPQRRIADLERQLAEAKAAARGDQVDSGPGALDAHAQRLAQALQQDRDAQSGQALGFRQNRQTSAPSGPELAQLREALKRAAIDGRLSPEQYEEILERAGLRAGGTIKVGGQVVYQSSSPSDPVHLLPRSRQGEYPSAAADSRLAPEPRKIPASFWLVEMLPFRWWYVWILFMVGTAVGCGLIALWAQAPVAFSVVAILTLVAIYAFSLVGAKKRFELLERGQVARVTGSQILTQGTYYSGTTFSNVKLPVARGWQVERPFYSGPSTKTRISYTVNGSPGQITVSGREYHGGVVLADPRNPARALCVTSFPYDLDRDASGNWTGRIRTGLKVQMAAWVLIVIVWLTLAMAVTALG